MTIAMGSDSQIAAAIPYPDQLRQRTMEGTEFTVGEQERGGGQADHANARED